MEGGGNASTDQNKELTELESSSVEDKVILTHNCSFKPNICLKGFNFLCTDLQAESASLADISFLLPLLTSPGGTRARSPQDHSPSWDCAPEPECALNSLGVSVREARFHISIPSFTAPTPKISLHFG